MDWRHRAICRDEDPELFFPVGTSGPALLQIAEAKSVCRRCPVVSECLTWALESGQDAGVWGGMSEDERRALKRRNARTRAHTACRNGKNKKQHPDTPPPRARRPDTTRLRARGRRGRSVVPGRGATGALAEVTGGRRADATSARCQRSRTRA